MTPLQFRGLREYRTEEPARLRQDLQRQNAAVAASLSALDSGKSPTLTPRAVADGATATADYGDLVVAGTNATVTLPRSGPDGAGRRVAVAMAGGGSVFVSAQGKDSVALLPAGTPYTMSTPGQYLEFADGGDGRWWRS